MRFCRISVNCLICVQTIFFFRGASIECRDKDKDTPLLIAASKNHLETIKSLLRHGADIGAKDSNDETPIYRAASEGCIEALEVRWCTFVLPLQCTSILEATMLAQKSSLI